MSFISYAQNYEDVMLWRALKNIEQGFYIDIGANDPEHDSVTKLFYDKGWRGINVEPVSQWFDKLEECRIRDINLPIAVGNSSGTITLYELPDTGLSTMDLAIAERHEKERGYKKIEREVPVETLTGICQKYHEKPIHFLKIDVEGAEKAVIEGLDLKLIRPWVIVIEATLPNTQTEDYELWESEILEAQYVFVYFDGLNRYYVADEHKALATHFKIPPNIFDEFIPLQQLNSDLRFQKVETSITQLETDLDQMESIKIQLESDLNQTESSKALLESDLNQMESSKVQLESDLNQLECTRTRLVEEGDIAQEKIGELKHSINQLNEELTAVYASKSWRIMLQLRKIMHMLIRLPGLLKQIARTVTVSTMRFVISQPRLKETALAILFKFPRIKAYLNRMALRAGLSTKHPHGRRLATANNLVYGLQSSDLPDKPISILNGSECLSDGSQINGCLAIEDILVRIRTELANSTVEKNEQ